MTKQEFAEQLAEMVGGKVREVERANGIKLMGIMVGDESQSVRPTIYVDSLYEKRLDLQYCAEKIREMAERAEVTLPDISAMNDYDKVKKGLRLRLYNKATKAEIFRSASEYGFDDLILIPYVENIIPHGYVKVTKSLLEMWNVSEDEIFSTASQLGEYEILPICEMLAEMTGEECGEVPEEIFPMFIITNKEKCYGAYGVIALKERLADMFPSGFLVLPSSVNEVIVIPKDSADIRTVDSMVKEVNTQFVDPLEVLGCHAYEF